MQDTTSSRRYAQAVMEIATENKTFEQWRIDLKKIAQVMQDPGVSSVLENPKVPFNLKQQILEAGLKDIGPMPKNLAFLLASRGKSGIAGQIAADFAGLVNAYYGIEPAEVTSAVPLDDREIQRITQYLSQMTGKKVIVKAQVKPDILGGFIARIGDKLIDGSVRTRLDQLKRSLAG